MATLQEVRNENAALRSRLHQLNNELDGMLSAKGQYVSRQPIVEQLHHDCTATREELKAVTKATETLRRENKKLKNIVDCSDSVTKTTELNNEVQVKDRELKALEEEIRSLRNVRKNREGVMGNVHKHMTEVDEINYKHREEMSVLRGKIKETQDEIKEGEKQVKAAHAKVMAAHDKLRLNTTGEEIKVIDERLAETDAELKELGASYADHLAELEDERKKQSSAVKASTDSVVYLEQRLKEMQELLVAKEKELKLAYRGRKSGK